MQISGHVIEVQTLGARRSLIFPRSSSKQSSRFDLNALLLSMRLSSFIIQSKLPARKYVNPNIHKRNVGIQANAIMILHPYVLKQKNPITRTNSSPTVEQLFARTSLNAFCSDAKASVLISYITTWEHAFPKPTRKKHMINDVSPEHAKAARILKKQDIHQPPSIVRCFLHRVNEGSCIQVSIPAASPTKMEATRRIS